MFEDVISHGKESVPIKGNPTYNGWLWKTYFYRPFDIRGLACCGLQEISSNPWTTYFSKESTEKFIKTAISKRNEGEIPSTGVLIATATGGQENYKEWLRVIGFKSVKTFFNPNSGNTVEMFLYDLPKSFESEKEKIA